MAAKEVKFSGINIVRRALQAPARQIAENAGEDGAVVAGNRRPPQNSAAFLFFSERPISRLLLGNAPLTSQLLNAVSRLERLVNPESLSITEKPELAPLDRLAEQYHSQVSTITSYFLD
jgi:hypothetical protein